MAMIQDKLLFVCSGNTFHIQIKQKFSIFPMYFASQITIADYLTSTETIMIIPFLLVSVMDSILILPLVI